MGKANNIYRNEKRFHKRDDQKTMGGGLIMGEGVLGAPACK